MTLLSRLFGKPKPRGKLETLIEKLDFDKVYEIAKERDEAMRTPTAISLALLVVVGKFCRSLRDSVARFNKMLRAPEPSAVLYDVVAYEAAAFFHYSLMRDHLSNENDDEDEDDGGEHDPYFDSLRDAAHLTSAIVNDDAAFDLPPEMFRNRILLYGLKRHTIEAELAEFQSILSCSIEAGTPAGGRSDRVSLDLPLGVALKTDIPIFYSTMIPALRETCRRLYNYDWE